MVGTSGADHPEGAVIGEDIRMSRSPGRALGRSPDRLPDRLPGRPQRMSVRRKGRIALWGLLGVLALAVLLPMGSYSLHFFASEAVAQDTGAGNAAGAAATNPRSNYWRAVKEGVAGYTAVRGPEANVLIQTGGTDWQQLRDGVIARYLPWLIVGMAVILLLYHLLHGCNRLDAKPLTGRMIKRWSWFSRLVHWVSAISFIALAITGLSMLIGKNLLIPLLGPAGFALWAGAAIQIHNVLGPVFSVGIICMILMWVWYNFPQASDWQWLKEGGGMFGKQHPSAGRMNAGEKLWFWLVALVGLAVIVSGVILIAPAYGLQLPFVDISRTDMQKANLVHSVLTIGWTAVTLGHIYMGSAGTEGALEGMATGYVSEEWAQQHHDIWADKMAAEGKVLEPSATRTGSGARRRSAASRGETSAATGHV